MTVTSTIRVGTSADVPAVQRLARGGPAPPSEPLVLATVPGHAYLLVVDAPGGGLAAAAHLTLDERRGHLGLLAVAPAFAGEGLEQRLIGVAEALCDAFGCAILDVPARRAA